MVRAATVATTATTSTDKVFVTFPDDPHRYGPCAWRPAPGPAYPARGDRALVAQDDEHAYWLLAWHTP